MKKSISKKARKTTQPQGPSKIPTMHILVAFELDERDRKAIALFYKKKGLSDKEICTFWVTMAVEAAQVEILEDLDEHERRKKVKR